MGADTAPGFVIMPDAEAPYEEAALLAVTPKEERDPLEEASDEEPTDNKSIALEKFIPSLEEEEGGGQRRGGGGGGGGR